MLNPTRYHRIVFAGLATIFMIFAGVSASGCGMVLGLPDVSVLKTKYPVVIYKGPKAVAENKPEAVVVLEKSRPPGWVDFSSVSKEAAGAIVVSEDWAFYHHKGYDPKQIQEAIKEAAEEGHRLRGASTITQQVARNVFLDQDRNLLRKIKEFFLAVRMEEKFNKRKILEVYLNIAELGEGIYGIGPAARFYFNKSPAELTAKEGAFLAMLLPSPKRYSQSFRAKKLTEYAHETVDSILDKMVQAGYLTDEERNVAQSTPLSFEAHPAEPNPDASPSAIPIVEPSALPEASTGT